MKGRNKVFIIIVALSVGVLGVTAVWGYNQVSKRKADYTKYLQAKASVKSEKDVDKAIKELEKIEKTYGESDVLKIDKASIYLTAGDSKKSQEEIEKALKINKALESNASFMIAYAETASANKDTKTVKEVIKKFEGKKLSKEDSKKIEKLKKSIK